MKLFDTVKRTFSFTLTSALLTETKFGVALVTSKVDVTDKLQCWIEWYPNGKTIEDAGHVSVYLCVNSPVKANYTFSLVGSSITENLSYFIAANNGYGFSKFATHQQIRDAFQNGTTTITCVALFEVELPQSDCYSLYFNHKFYETSDDIPHDCELVVGDKSIKAHKHLLSFFSPTLYANFTHDTVESKTNKIVITDFDYETVKASIDFLYGRPMDNMSVTKIVKMLRFLDKYNIKSKHLERIPHNNITTESFCTIVEYAYDCSKNDLFDECAKFFGDQVDVIQQQDSFKNLHGGLAVQILQKAFSVTSQFETLRQAHKYGISATTDYLENELVINFDNFCEAAKYAWDCDRAEFQIKCASFLSDYDFRARITVTDEFIKLGGIIPKIFNFVQDILNNFIH